MCSASGRWRRLKVSQSGRQSPATSSPDRHDRSTRVPVALGPLAVHWCLLAQETGDAMPALALTDPHGEPVPFDTDRARGSVAQSPVVGTSEPVSVDVPIGVGDGAQPVALDAGHPPRTLDRGLTRRPGCEDRRRSRVLGHAGASGIGGTVGHPGPSSWPRWPGRPPPHRWYASRPVALRIDDVVDRLGQRRRGLRFPEDGSDPPRVLEALVWRALLHRRTS